MIITCLSPIGDKKVKGLINSNDIILVYDVNKKRVSQVRKICMKYLHHVQNSVFEGHITIAQEEKMKKQLQRIIHPHNDCICIYHLSSLKYVRKEEIGKATHIDTIID